MCLAELADEAGNPVPAGVPSAKVLVTNLHNLTQPLIRYELTDRFTRSQASSRRLAARQRRRAGRRGVPLRHRGRPPARDPQCAGRWATAREYQVRQTGHGIEVACVTGGDLDAAALTARLEHALRQAGLPGPQVSITLAQAITRDPKTGKVRRFIPLPGPPAQPADAGC